MHHDLTAAHRAIEGIMQAVNNGCVADYGSFIVVMKSAVVVLSNCNVAAAIIRDEFKAAYLALYIMWQIAILRFLWRQGCAVWFCIERFFSFLREKSFLQMKPLLPSKPARPRKTSTTTRAATAIAKTTKTTSFIVKPPM